MVIVCSQSFFMIALTWICRPINSAPLLGHFSVNDFSSCSEGIHPFCWKLSQLTNTEGGPCVANNGSTDDHRRKSLSVVAIFSSLFPEFFVSLEDLPANYNYLYLKHCLDSSILCSLCIESCRMDWHPLRPPRSSDLCTLSRHNRCDHWFNNILSSDTNHIEFTAAFSTKVGHSWHLCNWIVVGMSDPNND